MATIEETVEVTPQEPTQQGTPEDLGQLREQLNTLRGQVEEKDKQYKTLQGTHSKTVEEARAQKAITETLARLDSRLDDLEVNQAVTLDTLSKVGTLGYGEAPVEPQAKESALTQLQAKREEKKRNDEIAKLQGEAQQAQANAFWESCREAGLDTNDPVIHKALFEGAATPLDSMKRIPRLVKEQLSHKEAEEHRLRQERAKAEARKKVEESGEDVFPTPISGESTPSEQAFREARMAYIKNPSNQAKAEHFFRLESERRT